MRKRTGAIHCDNQEEYIRVLFFFYKPFKLAEI